jgi:glycosyltransferase involved in cell wall biosynthesis
MSVPSDRPRLVFFVAEDWFFCSHFLDRALAARDGGFDVSVLTRVRSHSERIAASGLRLYPVEIGRRAANPVTELRALHEIWRIYRKEQPALVHHVALKPIVVGTIAAKLAGVGSIVNAPVGMGFVFTSNTFSARVLRPLLRTALRLFLNPRGSRVIFENPDDLEAAVAGGLVRRAETILIRGAGVDLDRFSPEPEPEGPPVVVLVARMLWEKGIGVFVEAARMLRDRHSDARFWLVGAPDPGNPGSIPGPQLDAWQEEGVVQWLGHRTDIAEILARSSIVCLPSYREGLPKSLLEALAAGRPIVATDVPGCRETVKDGENGILVAPRDARSLAEALETLIRDKALRSRLGLKSRQLAEAEFGTARVSEATLALYHSMLTG